MTDLVNETLTVQQIATAMQKVAAKAIIDYSLESDDLQSAMKVCFALADALMLMVTENTDQQPTRKQIGDLLRTNSGEAFGYAMMRRNP